MVIIDRSFSNLHEMAVWKYYGAAASLLFKIGSCGWQVQSDFNFLKEYTGQFAEKTALKEKKKEGKAVNYNVNCQAFDSFTDDKEKDEEN